MHGPAPPPGSLASIGLAAPLPPALRPGGAAQGGGGYREFAPALHAAPRVDTAPREVPASAEGARIKALALLLPKLQAGVPDGFVTMFNHGTRLYLAGRWRAARRVLEGHCLVMRPGDKPSLVLLEFMGGYGFRAPDDWSGVRSLTKK